MCADVNFSNMNSYNTYPSFRGNSARKLIEGVKQAKLLNKVHYTFDEMVKIYEELGFDVVMKGGSHAVVNLGDYNIPLVIPHRGEKYVSLADIKRLKHVIDGNYEAASKRV